MLLIVGMLPQSRDHDGGETMFYDHFTTLVAECVVLIPALPDPSRHLKGRLQA